MGGQERVRLLARQERRGGRDPDHECVEWLVEGRPPQLDRAEQGLGVGDGRRPREHGRRRPRPPQRTEHAAAHRFGRGREGEPQRGARDPLGGLRVVGIAAQQAREVRVVEDERDAEERDARRQRPLDERREAPALRASGLEQRRRRRAPLRLGVGGGEQRGRPAVEDGLRRADHDDEVRVDELARDSHPRRAGRDPGELRVRGVVHLHPSVEAAPQLRRDERRDLPAAHAAGEATGDEQRLLLGPHAELLERLAHRRDREPSRVAQHVGERQRRRLDDDRHPGGPCGERLQRLSVERKAQRLLRRRLDVRRAARRGRSQHARVVGRRRHDDAGAREEGDARHPWIQPARFAA